MDNNLITGILVKHTLRQKLSEEEKLLLEHWRAKSDNHRILLEKFRNPGWVAGQRRRLHAAPTAEMWAGIRKYIDKEGEPAPRSVLPRKTTLGRYAVPVAATIVGAVIFSVFWFSVAVSPRPTAKPVAQRQDQVKAVLPPHVYRALLKRGDGSFVLLDTVRTGDTVAVEGGYLLRKTGNVDYVVERAAGGKSPLHEELFTGNGGKVFLHWPDGTVVCLSRASRLRYSPDLRSGEPELDGEAGFYVAGDASRPLTVRIGKGQNVQVLGTVFDVRAYGGEKDRWVSLVEGAVRVSSGGMTALLKKHQQVRLGGEELQVSKMKDPSSALAWVKTGEANPFFEFDHTDLRSALKEVASWYGVTISSPENFNGAAITGQLSRKRTLEVTLHFLEKAQEGALSLRQQGDTVLVLPTRLKH